MVFVFYPISLGRQGFLTCVMLSVCVLLMVLIGSCSESEEKDAVSAEEDAITELVQEDEIRISFPAKWSIAPLTAAQIEEISNCALEELAAERYPDGTLNAELRDAFSPVSACDWAVLATAYAERISEDDPLSEPAKEAFLEAISRNYGFAVTVPLFYPYFGEFSLIELPPFVKQEITAVEIDYTWVGLAGAGDPDSFSYSVRIEQAHIKPIVSASVKPESSAPNLNLEGLDPDKVQALGPALTDLLPIESQFEFVVCTDNYPDWSISLTFKDGTQLDLTNSGSNFIFIGGPWQTKIDDQNYFQFSFAFAQAIFDLCKALGLPFGSPAGMYCGGDTLFEKAFPVEKTIPD